MKILDGAQIVRILVKGMFITFGVLLITGIVYLCILFPAPFSKKATEKDFIKNYDNIIIVTNYLVKSKYVELYTTGDTKDSETMFANLEGYDVSIDDSKVADAIDTLFKKGYSSIGKNGNIVHFQRSTGFRDFGSGIAYSIDGINKPQLEFLTKLESLSEQNWYYYEEDFNEFKRQHKEL